MVMDFILRVPARRTCAIGTNTPRFHCSGGRTRGRRIVFKTSTSIAALVILCGAAFAASHADARGMGGGGGGGRGGGGGGHSARSSGGGGGGHSARSSGGG